MCSLLSQIFALGDVNGYYDYTPKCRPGSRWKQDCNDCWCTDLGLSVCTRKGCLVEEFNPYRPYKPTTVQVIQSTSEQIFTQREANDPNFRCTPNTNYRVDCNQCFCNSAGTGGACTLKGCITSPQQQVQRTSEQRFTERDVNDPNFRCTPNSSFKVDCSSCRCSSAGRFDGCFYQQCDTEGFTGYFY